MSEEFSGAFPDINLMSKTTNEIGSIINYLKSKRFISL
jgi:hypothetical protein